LPALLAHKCTVLSAVGETFTAAGSMYSIRIATEEAYIHNSEFFEVTLNLKLNQLAVNSGVNAMSYFTKRKIRAAFEVENSRELERLCARLDSNIEFKYRGLKQSVSHHVARWSVSLECLKALTEKLGESCLTCRNSNGWTPIHLMAWFKDDSWLEFSREFLGLNFFEVLGNKAAHFAAKNTKTNASLRWLVERLGTDCLTIPDDEGNTAVHWAAMLQPVESLQFLASHLGSEMFSLRNNKGETLIDWVEKGSNNPWKSSKREWIASQKWQPGASLLQPPQLAARPLPTPPPADQPPAAQTLPPQPAVKPRFEPPAAQTLPPQPAVQPRFESSATQPTPPKPAVKPRFELPAAQPTPPQPVVKPKPEPPASQTLGDTNTFESSPSLVSKPLDPGFTSWSFVKQDDKPQLLGAGGFSKVFKALTDRYQTVAVKVIPVSGDAWREKNELKLEQRGIEILKTVKHPNIVLFLKCEVTSDGFCIFTELISGLSLLDLMKQNEKPIEESGVMDFSRQICSGLNFLHCQPQGPILHRDIKCSNIMLTHDGVIKLIDFGLAKEFMGTCGLTTGNQAKGTWHFMAPELFMDEDGTSIPYSIKTDVWAFGCTVFEMTHMKPPNSSVPGFRIPLVMVDKKREMPQIEGNFSVGLKEFYLRCIVRDPKKRADTSELLKHKFLNPK
ncbi:hypothetical protein BOX15_Mlig015280g2, partial [Macrostomum lignano]